MIELLARMREYVLEFVSDTLLFSSDDVPTVLVAVLAAFALAVFATAWQTRHRARTWLIAISFLFVPIAVGVVLLSMAATRGAPDDYCHRYDSGRMTLNILNIQMVIKNPLEPLGEAWIVLLVRAAKWGHTPHFCSVDMDSREGIYLYKLFSPRMPERKGGGNRSIALDFADGDVSITFGKKGTEEPNVTFRPKEKGERKRREPPETGTPGSSGG